MGVCVQRLALRRIALAWSCGFRGVEYTATIQPSLALSGQNNLPQMWARELALRYVQALSIA